tara:strand:- start:60 stop:473 length:414 start_codon:yes stop_codon:yes gene_type:complete
MSECKLVELNQEVDKRELVRQNLHDWCMREYDDSTVCERLDKVEKNNKCLINIFQEEVVENPKFLHDLDKRILEKKKEYKQLKHLETEINDYTNERDLQLLSNVNKNKFQELIILVIFLILYWCLGIYLMFNYLLIK